MRITFSCHHFESYQCILYVQGIFISKLPKHFPSYNTVQVFIVGQQRGVTACIFIPVFGPIVHKWFLILCFVFYHWQWCFLFTLSVHYCSFLSCINWSDLGQISFRRCFSVYRFCFTTLRNRIVYFLDFFPYSFISFFDLFCDIFLASTSFCCWDFSWNCLNSQAYIPIVLFEIKSTFVFFNHILSAFCDSWK